MVRRTARPRLDVQESFEATRLGPQHLIEAYTRLVPIRRTALRKAEPHDPPAAIVTTRRRGGGEHV